MPCDVNYHESEIVGLFTQFYASAVLLLYTIEDEVSLYVCSYFPDGGSDLSSELDGE